MAKGAPVPLERIEHAILLLRGHRVMLDADLAALYEVPVKRLNEQVRRNRERFPGDFMFQLSADEAASLRSQIATLEATSRGRHRKYLPYAFTEQGVAMLSSVLRGPRAVQANIEIMRAFVRLRRMLQTNADLAKKLDALEAKYDGQFKVVFQAIRELMSPPEQPRRKIGYTTRSRPMTPRASRKIGLALDPQSPHLQCEPRPPRPRQDPAPPIARSCP